MKGQGDQRKHRAGQPMLNMSYSSVHGSATLSGAGAGAGAGCFEICQETEKGQRAMDSLLSLCMLRSNLPSVKSSDHHYKEEKRLRLSASI